MKLPAFLTPSDAALVRGALRDDPRAFERLVLRYQRRAHAVARAAGVPESAADDAVQEAFLKAFRHLPALQAPESFGAWFLNIVRNAARDLALGARKHGVAWSDEAEAAGARVLEGAHPVEDDEIKELLWRKVAELPGPVREAVFLYYHEGESVRAVAQTLGASRSAVLKRLERGRAMLRERLWRKLEASVRGSLRSEEAWRRRGRQLTILLASAAAGSWGGRAAAAGLAGAAGRATGWGWKETMVGGLEMSGKKYAIAVVLGAMILGGGVLLIGGRAGRSALDLAGRPAAEPTLPGDSAQGVRGPASAAGEEAGAATPRDAAALVARSPGLLGRVTSTEGSPIRGARVLAVESPVLGSVSDRAGKLLANERGDLSARVREAAKELRGMAASLREARTDAAGEYRLEGLPPGEYSVLASHEEHLPRADGWALVRPGEAARCDVELSPAWRISGRIRDEEGRSVSGAGILAEPSFARGLDADERKDRVLAALLEGSLLLGSGKAESAPDGAFSLGSLEPSAHDLLVRKDGFAPARFHDIPAGKSDVEIILRRGLVLRGRILSPEKRPLEGVAVRLSADSPERPRPSVVGEVVEHSSVPTSMGLEDDASLRSATTDASGRFEITGLSPGSFALEVSREGYPALGKDIRLEEASVDMGDLILERPEAVVGRVLGPAGEPCAGARVWIEARTRGGLPGWGGRASRASILLETRTDDGGAFSLGPLPRGKFALRVSTARFAPAAVHGVAPGGEPIEVRLGRGIEIRGKVIDAGDGSPVEGARIVFGRGLFFDSDPEKDVTSGAGGTFSLSGIGPSEEEVRLSVMHPDYAVLPEVRLEGRRVHEELEVKLRRPESISGLVVDLEGKPVGGARVRCEIPGWGPSQLARMAGPGVRRAISAPDGSFLMDVPGELRSPHWRLEVVASHAALGMGRSDPVAAPADGKPWPEVQVILRSPSSLRGKVLDAAGHPVRGGVVTARRIETADQAEARGASRSAVTDGAGLYTIRGLEPGVYDVEARSQNHAPRLERGLDIGADSREHDFVLSGGIAIDGRVVDSSGSPVADAEVFAFATEPCDLADDAKTAHRRADRRERKGGMKTARTDGDGRYRLSHMPEEDITLAARAPLSQPSELQVVRPGDVPADLVIVRLSSISGTVVDSETGSPVPWFQVYMRIGTPGDGKELIPREFVDPSGAFFLEGLFPGRASLAVRARGSCIWSGEIELEAGAETTVHVRMERGATLRGTIVDSKTGLPIEHARIACQPRATGPHLVSASALEFEWTDASGAFAVPGLAPGKYWVHLYHPGYIPEGDGLKVTIAEDGNEPLRMAMIPAGSLEGRIANIAGSKSFDTRLELSPVEENVGRKHWTRVEPDGAFHATSILPGKYAVGLRQSFFKHEMEGGQVILPEDVEEKRSPLGEVEIVAGETARFEGRAP